VLAWIWKWVSDFAAVFAGAFFRPTPLFESLAGEILEEKKLRAKNTLVAAKVQLTRLSDHFGKMRVHRITERDWARYVAVRREKAPGCRLFDDRKYMRQVLLRAYNQGFLKRKIRLWIPDRPSSAGREITDHELKRLFLAAGPELSFQMEIALKMGLRLREMLGLRWSQIDWTRRSVRLSADETKTRRGREVPINPDLLDRFSKRFAGSRSPYVFPSPADPLKPQHDNKATWRTVKRKAEVRARWHDFRHTCATLMLRRGASVSATRRLLGMSEKVLREIYEHLDLDDLRRANAVMSDGRADPEAQQG